MKALMYFLVLAMIVIAACAKDDTMFENNESLELKKAKVPIPFKLNAYVLPDMESDLVFIQGLDPEDPNNYVLSRLICSGTASHVGKINPEKSFYTLEKLVFFIKDDLPHSKNTGKGILVGANGDGFEYTFTVVQNFVDGSCTGINEIIPGSGTGKFKGCTGTFNIIGGWHEDGIGLWFKNEGYSYLVFE
jgi:hypothetical protein